MASTFADTVRDSVVDLVTGAGDWFALFDGDPLGSGIETSTARAQTTWPASVAGNAAGSEVVLGMAAGTRADHFAVFDVSTGGAPKRGGPLPGLVVYGSDGTYTLQDTVVGP